MKILITGGAGFIGSNIACHHLKKGDHVWIVDNLSTGSQQNILPFSKNPLFQFDNTDMNTWPKLKEAVHWADRIYHMAAIVGQKQVIANPIETLSTNIRCCDHIFQYIEKDTRILIASTSSVYGHNLICEENEPVNFLMPFSIYQQTYPLSKFVNEISALSYSQAKNIHCVIARIFNTIGINQTSSYGMVVPTFIEQALANKNITVFGDGSQTRSFCNVKDTVIALEMLLENPKAKGEIVNVGNDEEHSILELAKLIIKKCNSSSEIEFVPYKEAYGIEFKDVQKRRPILNKLRKLIGFVPEITIEETLDEIIQAKRTKEKFL